MFHFQAKKKEKEKKKKRVSASNWIPKRNKSFDFFANFWETRGLKRSRVRRRGFVKPDLADVVAAEHHCCYICFFFFSVSLSSTHLSSLFSFFHFTFWFSPHVNFWWKFKLRWEVRGLCLYLHSLPPTWSCDQVKRHMG